MSVKVADLKITLYPDPVLRREAQPVEQINNEVRQVAMRMIELMHEARGVGLAAPQVGLSWRMFVANPSGEEGDDKVFINPVLRDATEQVASREEGCLSIPDVRAEIRRPEAITIDATDLQGNAFSLQSNDLPARIWQHETDHLDGILIIDRMSATDKLANRRLIRELEQEFNSQTHRDSRRAPAR